MATKIDKGPHLSYCAGVGWAGDGTKAKSTCPFNHSKIIDANRYKCSRCSNGTVPSDIIVSAKK